MIRQEKRIEFSRVMARRLCIYCSSIVQKKDSNFVEWCNYRYNCQVSRINFITILNFDDSTEQLAFRCIIDDD